MSPFANLYLLEKDIDNDSEDSGLQITFKHSLTSNGYAAGSKKSTLLHFDLFTMTRDLGFFRDNMVIHCTEAGKANVDANTSFQNPDDDNVVFSKFQPIVKVRKDFGTYLDDSFWSYFLSLEERFHTKDPMGYNKNSPDKNFNRVYKRDSAGRSSAAEEDSPIYALFLRKKNKRKTLLKYLELDGFRKRFRNFMALWIKEIHLDFVELSTFHSLVSTYDTLTFINKWIEQFMINRNDIRLPGQQADPKAHNSSGGGMKFDDLKRKLDVEKISLLIDKVSYTINISPPSIVWKFEIDQLWIDNIDEKHGPIMILDDPNRASKTLFFIKNIIFQASQQSGAVIENISFKLNEEQNLLTFSVDKFDFKSPVNKDQLILQFPAKTDSQQARKALTTQLRFRDGLLSDIDVVLSPVSLNLDKEDLCQELSVSAMLNEKLSEERGEIPNILSTFVFEKTIFEKVQHDLARRVKDKSTVSKQKKTSVPTKFGPFKSEETFQLKLLVESIQLNCIKDCVVTRIFG